MKHPKFAARFNQAVTLSGVKSTQKALGKLLGVSEVMIWSYRNGEKLPRMAMALNMAEEFGVSINWLLQGTGEPINLAITEKSAKNKTKRRRKSTQAIVDLVETFTEAEHKKSFQILSLMFQEK